MPLNKEPEPEPTIKFMFEDETKNTLSFLDIQSIWENYVLKFKFYQKPTNKMSWIFIHTKQNKI